MIIHVKPIDIKLAKIDPSMCPVERAIKRETGEAVFVRADWIRQRIALGREETTRYHCPRSVERFVGAFDSRRNVKPFNFRLVKLNAKGRS